MKSMLVTAFACLVLATNALARDDGTHEAADLLETYFADPSNDQAHVRIRYSRTPIRVERVSGGFAIADGFRNRPLIAQVKFDRASRRSLKEKGIQDIRAGLADFPLLGRPTTPTVLVVAEAVDGTVVNAALQAIHGRALVDGERWLRVLVYVDERPSSFLFWRGIGGGWQQLLEPPKSWLEKRIWTDPPATPLTRMEQMLDLGTLCDRDQDAACNRRLAETVMGEYANLVSGESSPHDPYRGRLEAFTLALVVAGMAAPDAQNALCEWMLERSPDRPTPMPIPAKGFPEFPEAALKAATRSMKERVVVEMEVDACGRTTSPRIIASTNSAFDQASLDAALETRYAPATQDGVGQPTTVRRGYQFELAPE